jgi:hypothetical protein
VQSVLVSHDYDLMPGKICVVQSPVMEGELQCYMWNRGEAQEQTPDFEVTIFCNRDTCTQEDLDFSIRQCLGSQLSMTVVTEIGT